MRVAIYARVSTKDQDCTIQLNGLRDYVARMGWTATEYVEKASGAKGKNRPVLNLLLADARMRLFDAVVCWKLDRFGRSSGDLLNNLEVLKAAGVRFTCPQQGIDTDANNPAARFFLLILSAAAEFERDMIVERMAAGYQYAQKHGTRSGNPIGGQRTVYDRNEVVTLRDSGLSWRAIAAQTHQPTTSVVRAYREYQRGGA